MRGYGLFDGNSGLFGCNSGLFSGSSGLFWAGEVCFGLIVKMVVLLA